MYHRNIKGILYNYTTTTSNYHTTLFKVPHLLQSNTHPLQILKYHTIIFKVPHHPTSKYHIMCHHLHSTTPASSKYNTTLFKVPHPPSSKYQPPLQSKAKYRYCCHANQTRFNTSTRLIIPDIEINKVWRNLPEVKSRESNLLNQFSHPSFVTTDSVLV